MLINIESKKADKVKGDNSLFVSFKYSAELVNMIKSLPKRYYHPANYSWEVPADEINNLIEMFDGHELHIKCPVASNLKANVRTAPLPTPVVKDVSNTLLPESFKFKTEPFTHQVEGLQYGLTNNAWLLGDEQGLGKTKQAIDLAVARKMREEIKHCIIICGVNGLKHNWRAEIKTHSDESSYIIGSKVNSKFKLVEGSVEERINSLKLGRTEFFLITNVESLRNKDFVAALGSLTPSSMIVFDEFHACKNPASAQSKGLMKVQAKYELAMTGTPVMNQPLDLYNILKWLGKESSSFYQFKNHYCTMGGYGNYQIVAYKNMTELRTKVDRVMLRRLKKDVLNLPAKIRHIEFVEMSGKQEQLYKEVLNEIKANLCEIELSNNPLSQLIRLRQVTGAPEILSQTITDSAKLDRLVELVDELMENGQKVVVFSQWAQVVKAAGSRLIKHNPAFITGDTDIVKRQQIVNSFQNDKQPTTLIGTIGAMGTGLTLTAASTVIFLDLPWTAAALEQAEDRLHRIGTTGTVSVICLTTKDTVDERIVEIVNSKKNLSDALVDGKMDKLDARATLDFLLS